MDSVVGVLVLVAVVIVGVLLMRGYAVMKEKWQEPDRRASAEGRSGEILDGVFDGSQVVSYATRPADALRAPAVIAGAVERGYTLVHDDNGTLTFQKG